MNCALSLFARKGFDAVRVDDIAHKASCNKAMIYYHFSSKNALYQAILQEVFEDMLEQMKPIFESQEPPLSKLRSVLTAFMDRYNDRSEFIQLMIREILSKAKHLKSDSKNIMKTFFLAIQKIITEGQDNGHIIAGNPLLLYRMLIGPIIFYLISRPMPKIIFNIDVLETMDTYNEQKKIILKMLMRGIQNDKQ